MIRNLVHLKLNTAVIIISLSIGLASINLISLFIFRELQTDDFHQDSKQIYSLTTNNPFEPGHKEFFCRYGSAEYIKQNFSQVEDFCRFRKANYNKILVNNTPYFNDVKIIEASTNFFEFFSYQLLTNNPKTALETNNNIVISNALAKKYFGTASPVGQIIKISSGGSDEELIVSAVFKKPYQNTQISFDMVKKIGEKDSPCFLQLSKGTSKEKVESLLAENLKAIPTMHGKDETTFYLSSLRDTYFTPIQRSSVEPNRDPTDLWIALGIGLLILLIAIFNYLGLVNNNLYEKHKEYAIRLINGSSKQGLIKKFMLENLTYLVISFVISVGMMIWAFPAFNNLVRTNLESRFLFYPQQLLLLGSSIIVLYLVSYLFVLLRLNSVVNANILLLKKQKNYKAFSTSPLTILQLVAAIVLITFSIVIIKQIHYISEKPIGINKQVVEIKLPWLYRSLAAVFRNELKNSASIDKVSIVSTSPVLDNVMVKWTYIENGKEVTYRPAGFGGDENYIETLGIQIVEGNDFGQYSSYNDKCLINQTMAQLFPDKNLIGNKLPGSDKTVIGIVEDFHYNNLKKVVEPAFIECATDGNYLLAKPVNGKLEEAKEYIAGVWHKLIPDYAVNIESINDRYEWLHRENRNFVKLISACCLISVFLSMIGLFAISVDKSHKRIKEIGIRKINGAKTYEVLSMLNKDVLKWIAIAFIIATPFAWYTMYKWLENFAYKTELSWWIFTLAGVLALGIALLTVSWQSWRAATRNPVDALRYE